MDVTQNVFVIVHRQLPGFESRSKLTTWLFSICRLVAKDYLRSAPIRREVLVDIRDLSVRAATTDTPLRRLDSDDLGRMLEVILGRLPEKLRVVFVLFELDEMSGDEIAQLLELPVGTVRSRLRLAREAFQREVELLGGVDTGSPIRQGGTSGVLRMAGRAG